MVVHAFYPLAETRVQREAEALIARGYEVDVICLRGSNEASEERHKGVYIYRLPVRLQKRDSFIIQFLNYLHFFLLAAIKLTLLHNRRRYSSIQVHNLPDFLVFCTLIPKLQGTPVILDLHDLMPEFFMAHTRKPMTHWSVRLVTWQEWLSCRFADRVITVTELWRQSLIKRGVPAYKTAVVMNVADAKIFHRNSPPLPPGNNGQFHIFYHGSQTYRYGLDLILRAVDRLRGQIPDIQVTLHGNGSYNDKLMELADELKLGDLVKFSTRFTSLEALLKMIRTADVAIVPYRRDIFTDGILPTKLMEYVAVGVPTIVTRTPVIETYFDNSMVEYFSAESVDDLANCILRLYHDPTRRADLVKNSDVFNQHYNWIKLSAEYVELVHSLTAPKKPTYQPSQAVSEDIHN
jgi:glycosyltransferase involved in cell wall biosynthesis